MLTLFHCLNIFFFLQSYETIKYVYFVFLQRFKTAII